MTENERDTHFIGFANILWDDLVIQGRLGMKHEFWLLTTNPEFVEELKRIIAQRAYDLAYHVISENMGGLDSTIHFFVHGTPDLTQWPDSPIVE